VPDIASLTRRVAARPLALGLGLFVIVAPLLALARQIAVLAVAWLVGGATDLVEAHLLPLLPVDPVYGGAGLRVLGGVEPRGLAVAGPPGDLLHQVLPFIFAPSTLTATDAAVSALVDPGVTVLARVLTALLATALLIAIVSAGAARLPRPGPRFAALLAQVWLVLDLAHETDLGVRDLEATGLPFALAALAPVDGNGQRVMLTTGLEALPDGVVAGLSAMLVVTICLLGAMLLRGGVRLVVARIRRHAPTARPADATIATPMLVRFGRGWSHRLVTGLPRLATLVTLAAILSVSPLGSLAQGETAVLISPIAPADDPGAASLDTPADPSDSSSLPAADQGPAAPDGSADTPAGNAGTVAAPEPAVPTSVPRGSIVTLEGGGYAYTLRVDGRPMVVRGMGYNPWYASLPLDQRQQRYQRDFSLMHEIGVNTVEGWFQDQFDEVTLDEADRQGLKVIMPFELNQDYDYSDPAVKAMFRQQVTDWVLRYRDHPAVLMWGPGNEVMHRLIFPTAVQGKRDPAREKRADDFAAFYVELMDLIHSLDPNHPVVYRDAEDLYLARFRTALLKDGVRRPWFIYGTNVYTQRLAEVINRWPTEGLDAPLLVSEFSPGGSGPAERPAMFGWYWSAIRAHPERVLGGVVYTWTTKGPEDLDRVFGLTDESATPVDGSIDALRQLFHDNTVGRRGPSR
jgi:hypothetical protein